MSRLAAVNNQEKESLGYTEFTFVGMPKRKDAPAAATNPGWGTIAKALADIVKSSGYTVAEVAMRADISRQYLYEMMAGTANPTITQIEQAFSAAGTSLEHWLNDRMLYGRDKPFHDKVQTILNKKGRKAIALSVIVEDTNPNI